MPRPPSSPPAVPVRCDSQTDLLGTKLDGGRYEVLDRIGAGGVGVIFRGRQAPLGRHVAIKLLRGPYTALPQSIAAFWREARAAALIDHPNVVRLIDFGYDEAHGHFIVMELLEGRRLEQVLEETPVPATEWTCRVMADVLAALAAAHDRGVIHQDVKPENVLLHNTVDSDLREIEVTKLCDFGLAALLQVMTPEGPPPDRTQGLRGTPWYMSPEQVRGERATASADVYACGVMLYRLVTGRLPFDGDNPVSVALKHVDAPPPVPQALRPAADPELSRIALKAMAKRPEDRFTDAREMRAALIAHMQGSGPAPGAPGSDHERPASDDDETRPYLPLHTVEPDSGDGQPDRDAAPAGPRRLRLTTPDALPLGVPDLASQLAFWALPLLGAAILITWLLAR